MKLEIKDPYNEPVIDLFDQILIKQLSATREGLQGDIEKLRAMKKRPKFLTQDLRDSTRYLAAVEEVLRYYTTVNQQREMKL